MKTTNLIKAQMVLVGLGVALAFAPATRAQQEVDPDHYDLTAAQAGPEQAKALPAQHNEAAQARKAPKLAAVRMVELADTRTQELAEGQGPRKVKPILQARIRTARKEKELAKVSPE
jgi:hypothetical protein